MYEIRNRGGNPAICILRDRDLPSPNELEDLNVFEDTVVVGYPDGLWDARNNLPIFRRAATATHPTVDYQGEPKFLIDCAIYPGSSGSPVFLYNAGPTNSRNGAINMLGPRVRLLGIVHATFMFAADGTVEPVPAPTQRLASRTAVPNNLGIVVKASCLSAVGAELISRANADAAALQVASRPLSWKELFAKR